MFSFLRALSILCFCVEVAIADDDDDTCASAVNATAPYRSPGLFNIDSHIEYCDKLDLERDKWYFFGGQLTAACVDIGRCTTLGGIWYGGEYPVGNETVKGTACSKISAKNCCGWSGEIKIKRCSYGFIYYLTLPTICSMAYCVGPIPPCTSVYEIYHRARDVCLERMWFSGVKLSQPYVSKSRMFGDFNATAFAVDCKFSIFGRIHKNLTATPMIRITFKGNRDEIESYAFNMSNVVYKITLEESSLVNHMDKTLRCEAVFYYEFPDGSRIGEEMIEQSNGIYLGVNVTDVHGNDIKAITLEQMETKTVYLRSSFPMTFGHCFRTDECNVSSRYIFRARNFQGAIFLDDCQVEFEINEYSPKKPIIIWARKRRDDYSLTETLSFEADRSIRFSTFFNSCRIQSLQVNILQRAERKRCHMSVGSHIWALSDHAFDNQNIGDFQMLSSKYDSLQIQVRQVSCMDDESTCTCGVIVREGNNLVGVTACDYKNYPLVVDLMHDDVNPIIIEQLNSNYMIRTYFGITIIVRFYYETKRNSLIMSVSVNAPSDKEYEGFCTVTATPENFENFRIPRSESFFRDDVPPCTSGVLVLPHCDCSFRLAGSGRCDYERTGKHVRFIRLHNVCDVGGHRERRERSVHAGGSNDVARAFADVNRENDKPPKVRTLSPNDALEHCRSMLARFTYSNECKDLIPETLDKIHKNWVDAAQLSGNFDLAWNYLIECEEACVSFLRRKIVAISGHEAVENSTSTKLLDDIIIEIARRAASQRRRNKTREGS